MDCYRFNMRPNLSKFSIACVVKNSFISSIISSTVKNMDNAECTCIGDAIDLDYFIKDLRPDFLIFDDLNNFNEISKIIKDCGLSTTLIVLTQQPDDYPKDVLTLSMPFSPLKFKELICKES